jgi:hypothetical protein
MEIELKTAALDLAVDILLLLAKFQAKFIQGSSLYLDFFNFFVDFFTESNQFSTGLMQIICGALKRSFLGVEHLDLLVHLLDTNMNDIVDLLAIHGLLVQRCHLFMKLTTLVIVHLQFNSVILFKLLIILVLVLKGFLQIGCLSYHL